MSVVINGTTGVQLPLGSASAPAETNTTAQTTGIYYPSSTTLGLTTNGTNALYIDASQNVGIGTTSPNGKLHVNSTSGAAISLVQAPAGQTAWLGLLGNGSSFLSGDFDIFHDGTQAGLTMRANLPMAFSTNNTERMRIDSSGNLLVGTTTRASVEKVNITHDGNSQEGLIIVNTTGVSNTQTAIGFRRPSGTTVGTITTTTSTTAYNTSSDYRLKNSVAPLASGLSTISALKPVSYKWNVDDSVGEGFIAHELAQHIPLAVAGEKDAVDADGNIKPQGVDYSKIVVHLVAGMQEQQAQITSLKAELNALKGTVDAQAAEIAALKGTK